MNNDIKEAMALIKKAMVDDNPAERGSYAHSWHCNIAMMCYDAMSSHQKIASRLEHCNIHDVANDAASRFMKLCFDVETSA